MSSVGYLRLLDSRNDSACAQGALCSGPWGPSEGSWWGLNVHMLGKLLYHSGSQDETQEAIGPFLTPVIYFGPYSHSFILGLSAEVEFPPHSLWQAQGLSLVFTHRP